MAALLRATNHTRYGILYVCWVGRGMCSAGKLPIGDHGLAEDVVTPRGPVADSELGAVQHESQRFSASCGVQANGGPVKMKFAGGSLLFHVLCEPRSTTVVLKTSSWEKVLRRWPGARRQDLPAKGRRG